jgi:hypothetical protein
MILILKAFGVRSALMSDIVYDRVEYVALLPGSLEFYAPSSLLTLLRSVIDLFIRLFT